jgi:hypothetical protein
MSDVSGLSILESIRALSRELAGGLRRVTKDWWRENHAGVARLVYTYKTLSEPGQVFFGTPLRQLCLSRSNPNAILRVSDRTFRRWIKVIECDDAFRLAVEGEKPHANLAGERDRLMPLLEQVNWTTASSIASRAPSTRTAARHSGSPTRSMCLILIASPRWRSLLSN